MAGERTPVAEQVAGLVLAGALAVQAFVILDEATRGEARRLALSWWYRTVRPAVVRAVEWMTAAEITEAMVTDEIEPMLRRESS